MSADGHRRSQARRTALKNRRQSSGKFWTEPSTRGVLGPRGASLSESHRARIPRRRPTSGASAALVLSIHPEDVESPLRVCRSWRVDSVPTKWSARNASMTEAIDGFSFASTRCATNKGRFTRWYWACTDIEDRKRAQRDWNRKTSLFEKENRQGLDVRGDHRASSALKALLSRVSKVAGSDPQS